MFGPAVVTKSSGFTGYFHHYAGRFRPWHLPSAAKLSVSVSQSYLF